MQYQSSFLPGADDLCNLWPNISESEIFIRNSVPNNDDASTNGTLRINNDTAKSGILDIVLNSTEFSNTAQWTDNNMDQNVSSLSLHSLAIDGNILKNDLTIKFCAEDTFYTLPLVAEIIVPEKGKCRRKKCLDKCSSSFGRRSSMRFKSKTDRSLNQTKELSVIDSPNDRDRELQHYVYEAPKRSKSRTIKEIALNISEIDAPKIEEIDPLESFTAVEEFQPLEISLQEKFEYFNSSGIIEVQMEIVDGHNLALNNPEIEIDSSIVEVSREEENITRPICQTQNERAEEDMELIRGRIFSTRNEVNLVVPERIKSIEGREIPLSVISEAAVVSSQMSVIENNGADTDQLRYQELLQWCCGEESVTVQDPYYPHSIILKADNLEGFQCSSDIMNLEEEKDGDDLLATMGRFYSDEEDDYVFNSNTVVAESRFSLDSCSSAETVLLAGTRTSSISTSPLPLLPCIPSPLLLDLDEIDVPVSQAPIITMQLIDLSFLGSNTIEIPIEKAMTETEYDNEQIFDPINGMVTEFEQLHDKQMMIFTLLEKSSTAHALQSSFNFIKEHQKNQLNSPPTFSSSSSGTGFVTILLSLLNNFNSCSFSCQYLSSTPPNTSCSHRLRDFTSFVTSLVTLIPFLQPAEEDIIVRSEISLFDSIEGERRKKVHFCDIDGSSVVTPSHNVSCGSVLRTTRRLHSLIGRIDNLIALIFLIDNNCENRQNEDYEFVSLLDSTIYCCEQLLLPDSAATAVSAMQQSLSLNIYPGDLKAIADIILSELLSAKKVPNTEKTDALIGSTRAVGYSRTVLRHRTGWMATSVIRCQLRRLLDPPPTMLTAKTGKIFSPSTLRTCDIYKMITMKDVPRPSISNKKTLDLDSVLTSKMTLSALVTQAMKQIYDAFITYYSYHTIPVIGSVDAYVTQLLISSLNKCVSTRIGESSSAHSLEGEGNITTFFHLDGMECSQPQVILTNIFYIEIQKIESIIIN